MKIKATMIAATLALSATAASAETSIRATGLVSTHKFHSAMEQEWYSSHA